MSAPLVSISIITYNQINFIGDTLASAIGQDYLNLEVIVADDGSTDGTVDIVLEYARKYPDRLIPLVEGPNLGITGNSNRALRSCKGKYIAFMGGDDALLPGKISAQVEWFEEDPNRVLCGHSIDIIQNSTGKLIRRQNSMHSGVGPKKFIENGCLFGATSVMVRKEALPEYGFREELPWVSDTMLWIETLIAGGSYGFVEGVYALYKKHDKNITNNRLICMEDVEKMYSIVLNEYPQWKRSSCKGLARCFYYRNGILELEHKKHKQALYYFSKALSTWPYSLKTWIRLLQSVLLSILG